MNTQAMLKAILDAQRAVQFVAQDYTPHMQPTTHARLAEALSRLCDAWDAVEDAEAAAYDEPRPDPNYYDDRLDDYREECKADCERTGRF